MEHTSIVYDLSDIFAEYTEVSLNKRTGYEVINFFYWADYVVDYHDTVKTRQDKREGKSY